MNGDDIIHIRSDRRRLIPIGTEVRFDLDIDMVRYFHPKTENAIIPEVAQ
jgi:hypothetical protein